MINTYMLINDIININEAPVQPGKIIPIDSRSSYSKLDQKLDHIMTDLNYLTAKRNSGEGLSQREEQDYDRLLVRMKSIQKRMRELETSPSDGIEQQNENITRVLKQIKKKCPKIFKIYADRLRAGTDYPYLMRGNSSNDFIIYGKPHTNRMPMDSHETFHKAIIDVQRRIGFAATRGNSIFVTSSPSEAKKYGEPFIIFPIGDFSYTWSRKHQDIVLQQYRIKELLAADGMSYEEMKGAYPDELADELTTKNVQKFYEFTDKDINEAMDKRHEICIAAPYYGLSYSLKYEVEKFIMNESRK